MGGQKINSRLTFTIILQLVILVVTGLIAGFGMNRASNAVDQINQTVNSQNEEFRLNKILNEDLLGLVNGANRGTITWEEAAATLPRVKADFQNQWQKLAAAVDPAEREHMETADLGGVNSVNEVFGELEKLFTARDHGRLSLFVANDLDAILNPFLKNQAEHTNALAAEANKSLANAQSSTRNFLILIGLVTVLGMIIAFFLSTATYHAIMNPINQLTATMREVGEGNYSARTGLAGDNELADLGQTFDQMLDERVNALVSVEQENEQLNDSIINLLQAVSQLSQRDLTVRVPVTEDMTGPVADALNLLTDETAKVLQGVNRISEEVATASDKVKLQSDTVIAVAEDERKTVELATFELSSAAEAMQQIAQLAQTCNAAAETAIKTTQAALQTVTGTVNGINSTRDTIRETEKRIKRLGERSQEISGVVNLINTIAERTHILALNASMHAASAGEAGRGFAVVADEVQRLAENAREATSQISTLVSNIQTETADTVNAMNTAISQVVDGSRLAEQAGDQMKRTQETTSELVDAVQEIAARSQEQARISTQLVDRAHQIQEGTRKTSQQLQEQTIQTTNLVEYAKNLLNSVRVFRLPA